MKLNSFNSYERPILRFLSYNDLKKIHYSTLEILENTGVKINHGSALKLLKQAGAIVEGKHVKIPEFLVKKALQTVPSRVVLTDRYDDKKIYLEGKNSYFGTGSCCPYTIDIFTNERKKSSKKDVANMAKISDYLSDIDFVMSMGLVHHENPELGYLHEFDAMIKNTTKPIIASAASEKNVRDIMKMAEIINNDEKIINRKFFFAIYSESTSPLRHNEDALGKLLTCAENNIPVIHTVGIMGGATAPVTKAGAIVQANAELLSALVVHQLKNQGAPFLYGGTITILDMKTMAHPYGAPEFHVLSSALTEMGEYYNMPVFSTGGCSDSKTFDQQAAAESIYSLLLAGLSGGNLIHDIGYIDSGLTSSAQQIVFSNEAVRLIKHIINGIDLGEDQLAIDVIEKVGPGGNFLSEKHTLDYFKKSFFPELLTRSSYNEWQINGEKTLGNKVDEVTRQIIKSYSPDQLPKETLQKLEDFISKKEKSCL